MKKRDYGLAVIAMMCVILAGLIFSFWFAIYGDGEYRFYEKEYRKYSVTDALDMEMEDVMDVTDHMMDYLIGKEEELSVITLVEGETQDFFNEQDRLHMADVKNLFLGGVKVGWICLLTGVVLLGILIWKKMDWKRLFLKAYSMALGVWALILAFLGIAFVIDFTRCFTIFHQIFFTNDLWIFDPDTDYMIRMLPEGFFSDMVIRIVTTFIVLLILLWGMFFVLKRLGKEKRTDK